MNFFSVQSLEEAPVSGHSTQENRLHNILGETTCTNSIIARGFELFSFAIIATLIFIGIQLPFVENWFKTYIPNSEYRFITKALLFFVLIYLLDRLVIWIRSEIDLCDFRDF